MTKASFSVLSITGALLILFAGVLGGAPRPALASSGDYVTGTVMTGQSKPAPSMWVMVYDGAVLEGRTLTGNDGRYYVGGLDEKTYTIFVRKQISGSNLASQSITLPQNRVCNIKLP
jgi:hypothetical protein